MGQVPRLPLLPCLGESAPDNTLLFPLPPLALALPCLGGLSDWIQLAEFDGSQGTFNCRGVGGFTIALLVQTSRPPRDTHKRLQVCRDQVLRALIASFICFCVGGSCLVQFKVPLTMFSCVKKHLPH